jgi:hypothetical protein
MRTPKFHTAALLAPLAFAGAAVAQVNLFSNGSADPNTAALSTGVMTASGILAPPGYTWSELQSISGNTAADSVAGFSAHLLASSPSGVYRVADDFTVTSPHGWRVSGVTVYAFQVGAPAGTAPAGAVNLRIWSGRPGDAGSTILFGDTTSNRMTGASSANIYRILSTVATPLGGGPDFTRLLWSIDASTLNGATPLSLAPGSYWLDWQFVSSDPATAVFAPPVTTIGSRAPANANARQLKSPGIGGAWTDALDPGKPASAPDVIQDLAFIISGSAACPADFSGDGVVNSQDFFDFLTAFFTLDPRADFDGDGQVTSQDFFDFLTAFFAGC